MDRRVVTTVVDQVQDVRLGDPLANCTFSGERLHDQDSDQQQVSCKAEC